MKVVFASMTFNEAADGKGNGADQVELRNDVGLSWHEVAGRRFKRAKELSADRQSLFLILGLSVALEPLRCLHSFFMKSSLSLPDFKKPPPLLDILHPPASIVQGVLQYLSHLLRGSAAKRWRLVYGQLGHDSFDEWQEHSPSEVTLLRRILLVIVCQVQRRHASKYNKFPWRLLSLGDARMSPAARCSLVEEFMGRGECCYPFGAARKIRGSRSSEELLSAKWASMSLHVAWGVPLSIASVESRHKRNRMNSNKQMTWGHFAAQYMNAEARSVTMQLRRVGVQAQPEQAAQGIVEGPSAAPSFEDHNSDLPAPPALQDDPLRAQSAINLFRKEWLRKHCEGGRVVNPCSSACWAEVVAAYDRLDDDRRRDYETRSEASVGLAQRSRRQRAEASRFPSVLEPSCFYELYGMYCIV